MLEGNKRFGFIQAVLQQIIGNMWIYLAEAVTNAFTNGDLAVESSYDGGITKGGAKQNCIIDICKFSGETQYWRRL